ncbi:Alcohol dehydrogenase, C-terminal [Artemisia annua]|uniref:Alcohol dehydrogenase, C-terminal n=1 Tax=Artemisia annua TaxID=35608 RepID=A0A2U1KP36_ARTAN|nr:Alcohol dehydrogenase, C-terminal [Artemisia annua]
MSKPADIKPSEETNNSAAPDNSAAYNSASPELDAPSVADQSVVNEDSFAGHSAAQEISTVGASTNLADQVGLEKDTIPYINVDFDELDADNTHEDNLHEVPVKSSSSVLPQPQVLDNVRSFDDVNDVSRRERMKTRNYTGLCEKLLAKSQTVVKLKLLWCKGSWLLKVEIEAIWSPFTAYAHLGQQHLDNLVHLFSVGKLKVAIDPQSFVGIQSVADAVEYLHSGKSVGKVVVCIDPSFSQQTAKL